MRAATAKSTKKMMQKTYPPVIWLKIIGKVLKTSPIPAVGFTPNEKAAGKMTTPASTATSVSARVTERAVVAMLSSFLI